MPSSTLTSKGQLTVPKEVRDILDLHTGDRVLFRILSEKMVVMEPETVDLLSLCGVIKPKITGISLDAMKAETTKGWSRK